jgi:2-haloacid dehalogenase
MKAVKALVFDVFGTVVDWRSSIIRNGEALSSAKGIGVDWAAFADAWRAGYQPAMQRARAGEIEWTNIDGLHRSILDEIIPRFGLDALDEADRQQLNRVWHRLDAWPDAVEGLALLKQKYVISTLSNGNVSLLVNMAKHAKLPWDCVLSAEIIQHYKPDPEVYQMAAKLLGFERHEVLMVAAHPSDLRGAARAGLPTAYVKRPDEYGPNPSRRAPPDALPDDRFDIVVESFVELATTLERSTTA